jgi:hypothetical protein
MTRWVRSHENGGALTPPVLIPLVSTAPQAVCRLRRLQAHQHTGRAGNRHREAAQEGADHRVGKALQNHVVQLLSSSGGPSKGTEEFVCNDNAGLSGRVRCEE